VLLSLPSLDPRGPLDPLSHLGELRGNRLNVTLDVHLRGASPTPATTSPVPSPTSSLGWPASSASTDLADNNLCGPILAAALGKLTGLLTLKLQDSLLTGLLPDISVALPNLPNNQLSGRVPDGMRAKFGFAGIAGLGGGPVPPPPPWSVADARGEDDSERAGGSVANPSRVVCSLLSSSCTSGLYMLTFAFKSRNAARSVIRCLEWWAKFSLRLILALKQHHVIGYNIQLTTYKTRYFT
jgi:hypothetical protein